MKVLSLVDLTKEKLNQWLQNGTFSAGDKLPSERELESLLDAKRMTLRQALLGLEAESKIFRKDRKGWFVGLPRFNYDPKQSVSFKFAAIQQGFIPSWGFTTKLLVAEYPALAQKALNVEPHAPLYLVTGWGALNTHRVFYHETYINPAKAQGFIDTLGNESFAVHWKEKYGKQLFTKQLAFKPIRLAGEICRIIGGSTGTPAIFVEKYRSDENDCVIQVDFEYWRFESVNFFVNLRGNFYEQA